MLTLDITLRSKLLDLRQVPARIDELHLTCLISRQKQGALPPSYAGVTWRLVLACFRIRSGIARLFADAMLLPHCPLARLIDSYFGFLRMGRRLRSRLRGSICV